MKTQQRTLKIGKKEVQYAAQLPENEAELKELCGLTSPYDFIHYRLISKLDRLMKKAFTGGMQFNIGAGKKVKVAPLDAKDTAAVEAKVKHYSRLFAGKKKKSNADDLTEAQLLQQMRKRLIARGITPDAADSYIAQYEEVSQAPVSKD